VTGERGAFWPPKRREMGVEDRREEGAGRARDLAALRPPGARGAGTRSRGLEGPGPGRWTPASFVPAPAISPDLVQRSAGWFRADAREV
jgi:hypothetical protein